MQILRYQGRDLRDALQRARRAHGDDAVVLSHESTPDGGVTVAIAKGPRTPAGREARRDEPGASEVERRLQSHGASRALVRAITQRVAADGARGIYALDAAAEQLERAFQVAPSPKAGGAPLCFAFVGPSGAGKTLSLAKLAGRLSAAGRKVVPITLDTSRAGIVGLREALGPLSMPAQVARDGRDLLDLVRRAPRDALTLVDTAGRAERGYGALRELARAGGDVHPWLVASAASSAADAVDWLGAYRGPRVRAALVAQLDRATRPAEIVEALARRSLAFNFFARGATPDSGLIRVAPAHFADLFLRGRLSTATARAPGRTRAPGQVRAAAPKAATRSAKAKRAEARR